VKLAHPLAWETIEIRKHHPNPSPLGWWLVGWF
jgi:hypothetical protein